MREIKFRSVIDYRGLLRIQTDPTAIRFTGSRSNSELFCGECVLVPLQEGILLAARGRYPSIQWALLVAATKQPRGSTPAYVQWLQYMFSMNTHQPLQWHGRGSGMNKPRSLTIVERVSTPLAWTLLLLVDEISAPCSPYGEVEKQVKWTNRTVAPLTNVIKPLEEDDISLK